MDALYNRIGNNYNYMRRADPYIAARIAGFLDNPAGKVLDIGCGTGNYTIAVSEKGWQLTGADPSEKMLNVARQRDPSINWVTAAAENLPFENNTFDAAFGTVTLHHWTSLEKGFAELFRVLKAGARLIIFSTTAEQTSTYWLAHYFPQMIKRSVEHEPSYEMIFNAALSAGFDVLEPENYFVRTDLQDKFMYSGKDDPEIYFDEDFRKGISSFANLSDPQEVEAGLAQLRSDIQKGEFARVRQAYENNTGDYVFVRAVKPAPHS